VGDSQSGCALISTCGADGLVQRQSPIVAKGVVAGLPLLAFKIVVLCVVFDAFIYWQKQQPTTSAPGVSAVPDVREARL